MPTISYGRPISSSAHSTRRSRVLPRANLFTRENPYTLSWLMGRASFPGRATATGHLFRSARTLSQTSQVLGHLLAQDMTEHLGGHRPFGFRQEGPQRLVHH